MKIKITHGMTDIACEAYSKAGGGWPDGTPGSDAMEAALTAALEGYELAPFELTQRERMAFDDQIVCAGVQHELRRALERATRTLVDKTDAAACCAEAAKGPQILHDSTCPDLEPHEDEIRHAQMRGIMEHGMPKSPDEAALLLEQLRPDKLEARPAQRACSVEVSDEELEAFCEKQKAGSQHTHDALQDFLAARSGDTLRAALDRATRTLVAKPATRAITDDDVERACQAYWNSEVHDTLQDSLRAALEAVFADGVPVRDIAKLERCYHEQDEKIRELESRNAFQKSQLEALGAEVRQGLERADAAEADLAEKTDLLCRIQLPRDLHRSAFEAAQSAYVQHAGSVSNAALDYALNEYEKYRLTAPATMVEPLSDGARTSLCDIAAYLDQAGLNIWAEYVRGVLVRFPKPVPVAKPARETVEDVLREMRTLGGWTPGYADRIEAAMAKGGSK